MERREQYEVWHKLAKNDLDWAELAIQREDWPYLSFFCQQAVEKLAKGLYTLFSGKEPPKIHEITDIIALIEPYIQDKVTEERIKVFNALSSYYVEVRYPDFKQDAEIQISEQDAKMLFSQSKEAFEWLLTQEAQLNATKIEPSIPLPKP